MNSVKDMVLQISVLSIIIGIVMAIKPYGKYDSQLKLFTSCIMFIGILSPFFDSIKNIDPDFMISTSSFETADELTYAADEEVLRLAESELEDALKLKLAEESVPCSRITVCMNTNEDQSINISSVTIVSTKAEDAERTLRNILGKDVEINAEENF